MKQLILATGNAHKAKEFATLLNDLTIEVLPATACGGMPNVVEDGDTFAANAQIKAKAVRTIAPDDAWVLADDSGLVVDALGGAPGIYSARYAGPESDDRKNLEKLLAEMKDLSEEDRSAHFYCVLCLIDPDGHTTFYDGSCSGRIARQASGLAGFGYDPVFLPDGYEKSFAEMGETVKSGISHRARAAEWLASILKELENATA